VLCHLRSLVDRVAIMELVDLFVSCRFFEFAVDIVVDEVLGGSGESEEDPVVAMRVSLCWAASGFAHGN
jgi:hypothetical protein